MLKKLTAVFLVLLMFTGCQQQTKVESKQYNATFLTLFDTVTTVVGKAESQEAFTAKAQTVHDSLLVYHQLFDIYNDYDGIVNLKAVNEQAANAPIVVDPIIIDLLLDCKEYYVLSSGKVNVAMGSVLALWHEARNEGIDDPANASLPDIEALKDASAHTDFDTVVVDEAASTVYFTDPAVRLDVGAVAKGWATQRVAETAPEGLLISVGGNVCATGPKDDAGTPWVIGVNSPDGDGYLHTLTVTEGSVVTSGDYQRYYTVDGKNYHHIIDPETLMPSEYWRSVTVLCPDSGLADALSTALFLLSRDDGQALLDICKAEAMWVDDQGQEFFSPGFQDYIKT